MIRNQSVHDRDRLYLSQGDDDNTIFIESSKVPQHHIEGVRFLYRQFKRRKTGVIINDPFSFGRNLQIILFLNAVRRLLIKPVLILCQEGTEQDWSDRFCTWTEYLDDVVIESSNPMVKSKVIINAMVNLHLFCAREWSIIVVDGDQVTSPNPILKLPFKANFKIWNTSVNMKDNLDRFEEVYKWVCPHEIFDKHYFIADAESAVDIIEKSILLDSFLEDIVLRRDDLNSSFEKYQRENVMPPPKPVVTITAINPAPTSTATRPTNTTTVATAPTVLPLVTISKKNKDATGTKIKRSKTRIETETANKPAEPPSAAAVITKFIEETSKDHNTFESTEDFSIQNYKRKNSKDHGDTKKDNIEIIEIDNMSNQSDIKLYYEPDSEAKTSVDKLEEMDTLVFGHDTFISKVGQKTPERETEPHTILTCKPVSEQTSHSKFTDSNKTCTITSKKFDEASKSTDNERDKKNDRKSLLLNRHAASCKETETDHGKMNIDELNKEMRDLGTRDILEKNVKRQKITDITSVDQSVSQKSNEVSKETSVGSGNTEQVSNSLKRNNIDEKMKECEEKVSKKFKGSFLDSLF